MNSANKIKLSLNKTLTFSKGFINVKIKSKNPEISQCKFIWTVPTNLRKFKGKILSLKLSKKRWLKWLAHIKFNWPNSMIKFITIKKKSPITDKLKINLFKETDFKKKNSKISQLQFKIKEKGFKK